MRAWLLALLMLSLALAGCSGGGKDRDGDGISDALELDGWATHTIDLLDRRIYVKMTSDPAQVDTDGDGLTDHEELLARTNPREPDTDFDGLSDCQELVHTVLAECQDPGFDHQANGDGGYPTDPRNADSDPGSRYKRTLAFTDETGTLPVGGHGLFGDGISDGDEILGYTVQIGNRTLRVTSDPRLGDTDGDGLEDGEERLYGSDPGVVDSDGDGCTDGLDPWPGVAESYLLTPETITLHQAAQGSSARIRLDALLVGRTLALAPEGIVVQQGSTVDARAHADQVAGTKCNLPAYDAWARVRVLPFDLESETYLDADSLLPEPTLRWNVRTGAMEWGMGNATSGPTVTWRGAALDVAVTPVVVVS